LLQGTPFAEVKKAIRRTGVPLVKKQRQPGKSLPDPYTDADRSGSVVRVLVVEDNKPFRRFLCSALGAKPEVQIVCEVGDGLDAVQKAEELQPDLVLLDIGLPGLNGIEAGRRIRRLSPKSKILFVSQESSADFVQEALHLGALGYVIKSHAGSDLMAAVEAVLRNERFVSASAVNGNGHR
jgi:DNA-binding NarL/FixJ family response regulator